MNKAISKGAVVMDAVYDPPETRLLRDAAAQGAKTIGGKWMLVYQAAEQFSRFGSFQGCAPQEIGMRAISVLVVMGATLSSRYS